MTDLSFLDHPDTRAFTPGALPSGGLLEVARTLDALASQRAGWDAPAMLYGLAHQAGAQEPSVIAIPVLGDGDQLDLVQAQAVPANLSALFVRVEGFASLSDFAGEAREVRILSGVDRAGETATVYRDRRTDRQIVDWASTPLSDLLLSKLSGAPRVANIFGR